MKKQVMRDRDYQPKKEKEFDEEVISIDRISRMTAGGRRMRFRAVVVIGNRKDKLGLGIAKANDVSDAIRKASKNGKKNLITVPLTNDTIPFEKTARFGAAKVILKPAATGTGVIAGGSIRKALELGGVQNILSKVIGTQNKLNNLRAVFKAFNEMAEADKLVKSKK